MELSPKAVIALNVFVVILLVFGLAWYKHWI